MMNWDMTDEEKLLKVSADNFFREKLPLNHLRRLRDSQDQVGFARDTWQEMAALGWTGILIAEEFGGMDFGFRGLGLIMAAAGPHLSSTPLLSTVACASYLIQNLGNKTQQDTLLPLIASGESIICVAHDEGRQHGDQGIELSAQSLASGFLLDGRKTMVLDAGLADHILVLARSDAESRELHGLSWFIMPKDTPGIQWEQFRLVDGRPAAHIVFKNVELKASALLGSLGQAGSSYEEMRNAASVSLAAEMLGSATAAFEMTLAYLKERKQFGVAIGSFQALQHRMAWMYSELEVSRSIVQRALVAMDERSADASLLASLAKAKLSDLFSHVAAEAIQLHGGIGMTDEHNIGFFLKRSRIHAELFGNASFHRDRYARALGF